MKSLQGLAFFLGGQDLSYPVVLSARHATSLRIPNVRYNESKTVSVLVSRDMIVLLSRWVTEPKSTHPYILLLSYACHLRVEISFLAVDTLD